MLWRAPRSIEMTTPGRLHLTATLVLLVSLAGIGIAQAGVLETPTGGFGVIDRPVPDGFGTADGRGRGF